MCSTLLFRSQVSASKTMAAFSSYQSYHSHLLVDSTATTNLATASSSFPHSSVNPPNAPEHRSRCSSLAGVVLGDAQLMTNSASGPDAPTAEAKRKSRDCTSSDSAQLKVAERSSRKQRKLDEGDQAVTGYVHVRARRGQATDSHSLAERVRREKIRERMNLLQGLVPGCDKITGKALMLDEIINYVQSLQNQVEFLSMKLASMNPLLYNSGCDLEGHMNQAEKLVSMPQEALPIQPVLQSSPIQHIALEEALGNYPVMETPLPLSLHNQGAIALSQDNGSFLMQVADKRQELLNQVVFRNMCSFH